MDEAELIQKIDALYDSVLLPVSKKADDMRLAALILRALNDKLNAVQDSATKAQGAVFLMKERLDKLDKFNGIVSERVDDMMHELDKLEAEQSKMMIDPRLAD